MCHDLLALLKECVPLSIASMIIFNVSSIHMPLLVVEGTQFNYGDDLFICGSRIGGRFSLFNVGSVAFKSSMQICFLWGTMSFMIVFLVLGLASNNLVECIMDPPRVYFFLPRKQPKNVKSVVNLKTLLKHVHGLLE
jgi:hypothetical protein